MTDITEQDVIHFLNTHPEFLREHKEILQSQALPHEGLDKRSGRVVSFIEYQTQRQRETLQAQQSSIEGLQAKAEQLTRILQSVHSSILEYGSTQEVIHTTEVFREQMQTLFDAKQVQIFLFSSESFPDALNQAPLVLASEHDKRRTFFLELFFRRRALCDMTQDELVTMLFGTDTRWIRSTLVYPLLSSTEQAWSGLLALASDQRDRYAVGAEIECLGLLCDVFAERLDQCFLASQPETATIASKQTTEHKNKTVAPREAKPHSD